MKNLDYKLEKRKERHLKQPGKAKCPGQLMKEGRKLWEGQTQGISKARRKEQQPREQRCLIQNMLWMERKASLSCRTVIPSQGSGGYRNSKPCSPGLYHHQSLDALSAPFSAFTAPNKGLYKHRARLDFETVAQLSWSTPNTSTKSSTALNTGFLWGILQQPAHPQ